MSEFHDPDLRQQLGRLSGPYPDDNVAFAAWQRRVGQARRRRAMAWTTGAAMSLIVGTVAVSALQSPARHSVVPGKSSETSVEFTVSIASTEPETTDPSTTESSAPETSAPTTLAPDTTPSSEVVAESSVPEDEGNEGSGSQGSGGSKGHGGSPTSAAPATPQGDTETFSSGGGSITVHNDGETLTVVGTNPAAGFHAKENNHSGRKVEVTFKSGNQQFDITVRLSDGVMKPSVSEEGNDTPPSHQDSVPDGDGDNNHGGDGDGGGDSD
jgi:hypothetical protein